MNQKQTDQKIQILLSKYKITNLININQKIKILTFNFTNSSNTKTYISMLNYLTLTTLVIFNLINKISCIIQYPPTWLTSNYIRSGNQNLFTTLTGSTVSFTYTFPFSSNLSGIPNLGYGIKAYQGNDYFGQQRFQINRTDLTAASFTVAVQLIGATNLYILNVPYIAIDPQFPHHVNSFDNVPVNYNAGPLINVTVKNYFIPVYYWNIINYTQQAGASRYTHFSTPLQNNKILFFMTSMYITGINQASAAPPSDFNPLNLHIYHQILTNQTYLVNVTLSIKINLERLQYSMIIFDQADVQSSLKYYLVYQIVNFTDEGGFIPIPAQFIDNFIMGFTQFSSNRTLVAIHFSWDFTYIDGVHGVLMPKSIPKSPEGNVINRIQFTVFYMKTWVCPNFTFINHESNMCELCSIQGCETCLSLQICGICNNKNHYKLVGTKCVRCDVDNNYYLNKTTMECQVCSNWQCPPPIVNKDLCNSIVILISITQIFPISCNMSEILIQNQGITVTSATIEQKKSLNGGPLLQIYAEYNRDVLQNQNITIFLGPNDKRVLTYSIIPLMYYNPQECQAQIQITNFIKSIQIVSYILLFLSLFSCKIVGLELFGVLQLAYFSLGSYSYLDIYISPLSQLSITNGYNMDNVVISVYTNKILSYMGISSSFLNNLNIMALLIFALPLIVGVCVIITKFTLNKILERKLITILKQGSITLILFNILNISYSFGVHLIYAYSSQSANNTQFLVSTVFMCILMALCIGFVVYLQASDSSQYGQFKNKFKPTWICLAYVMFSLIYRTVLAIYSSTHSYYQQSTLLILGVCLIYMMYFIVNLPFISYYQNYRAGICHITQLIILFVANYYRSMKSNTPLQIKSKIHSPAILVLFMLGICVVLSALVLCWEIFIIIRQLFMDRKNKKIINQERRHTQASMVQLQAH